MCGKSSSADNCKDFYFPEPCIAIINSSKFSCKDALLHFYNLLTLNHYWLSKVARLLLLVDLHWSACFLMYFTTWLLQLDASFFWKAHQVQLGPGWMNYKYSCIFIFLSEKALLVPGNTFCLDAAIHSGSIKFSCLCICSMQVFVDSWLTEMDTSSLISGPAAVEL